MLKNKLFNSSNQGSFNMTPIVDIVFLLIIFFMLVCQFIIAENFEVALPENTASAQTQIEQKQKITTVSVMLSENNNITYAVGSEIIGNKNKGLVEAEITNTINAQLSQIKDKKKIVCIRMDRDIRFDAFRPVLAGITNSLATDVQFAVLNNSIKR